MPQEQPDARRRDLQKQKAIISKVVIDEEGRVLILLGFGMPQHEIEASLRTLGFNATTLRAGMTTQKLYHVVELLNDPNSNLQIQVVIYRICYLVVKRIYMLSDLGELDCFLGEVQPSIAKRIISWPGNPAHSPGPCLRTEKKTYIYISSSNDEYDHLVRPCYELRL